MHFTVSAEPGGVEGPAVATGILDADGKLLALEGVIPDKLLASFCREARGLRGPGIYFTKVAGVEYRIDFLNSDSVDTVAK